MFSQLAKGLRTYAERDGRGYPDWATRYLPVIRILGHHLNDAGTVLEIGANANGLSRFADTSVVAVDIEWEQLLEARKNPRVLPVQADIGALPFRDGQFSVVVCMDTFEHLPPEIRRGACAAILRAVSATGMAVVGFPSGAAASAVEARIRARYRACTGGAIRWLEEHDAFGLPKGEEIAALFRELADGERKVSTRPNTSIWVWQWMWLILMCGWPGRGNALFQVLLRWSVPVISRCHRAPCYRTLITIEAKPNKPS